MRKLLIIHHSSVIGGAAISLFNLIQLAKESFEITIYVSDLHDDYYKFLKTKGINVKKYKGRIAAVYFHASSGGLKNTTFWHRLALLPVQFQYWRNVIKESKADLVLVNSLVLCWFSILTVKNNIKSLCFVRETFANKGKGLINKLQRKLLSNFTGVSFISEFDLKVAKLPANVKTFINHNYIATTDVRQELKEKKEVFSVLYIGGISKVKGIEVVVEAANILKSFPNIKFTIVGEDYRSFINDSFKFKGVLNKNYKLSKIIRKRIKRLHLESTITFHGIQEDMHSFFMECDVLICPITTPHQQRGIFEAGWYSKPVVVSNFEQLHWALKSGYNGEFFEPNNGNALASKILKLYNNKDLCEQEGYHNKLLTVKNHTIERCNSRILATLKNIIDE